MNGRRHRNSLLFAMLMSFALLLGSVPAMAALDRAADDGSAVDPGQIHTLPAIPAADMPETLTYLNAFSGHEPQLVIGPDSRVQITDTTQDPYKKIVSIWAGDPNTGEGFGCTGTFIGSRVIMTAAHCIWFAEFNGFPGLVTVTPGLNVDQEPYGRANATNLWVPQGWIDAQGDINTADAWDYALIVLNDDTLGNTVGTMTIGALDDNALMAADFNPATAGYPGDKPQGTMWFGTEPAFTGVTAVGLDHAIDSFQGQSGSAVWRTADQLIVGIESYETETINVSRRITQSVIDDYTAVCQQLGCAFNVAQGNNPPPPPGDGNAAAAFQRTWERTDKPVADGQATRTWIWGPQPNSQVIMEAYDEAPGGMRQVQYYDKSRMEITDPNADPNSIWYVTNGLLATELITGRMQLGNNRFDDRNPANVNVAGDANDPNGPTYATFNGLLGAAAQAVGTTLTQRVDRAGQVTDDQALVAQGITVGFVDDVTSHGIAAPFWDFMNSSGTVYENGAFVTAQLFDNAFFATGRPITEPYWANVLVGGAEKLVLIQCFERRCLTYTPDNAPVWRVEMGNIGQHYFAWRSEDGGNQPPANPPGNQPPANPPGNQPPANPPGNPDPPANPPVDAPVDVCLDAAESEFLTIINQYRADNNLPPLAASAALNAASYNHSLDMAQRGYFAHDTPEGLTPGDRAAAAGYNGLVAENIAAGNQSAQDTFEQWRTSPGHNANMLSENAVIGIGRAFDENSPFGWYWTTKFGNVADAPPANCG